MLTLTPLITYSLAVLTVLGDIAIIFLILIAIKARKKENSFTRFVSKNGMLFAFLVTLLAVAGSLYYSNIAGFAPCSLCWYQRAFMFPLVFILGLAVYRKESVIARYGIFLASIGAIISVYHQYLQFGGNPLIPCSAATESVACSARFIFEFGYVTIPMMTLTAFLLIITFLWFAKKR